MLSIGEVRIPPLYRFPQGATDKYFGPYFKEPKTPEGFEDLTFEFNITVIGDYGVGKSSLVERYVNNIFRFSSPLTIGTNYFVKYVQCNSDHIKLKIWDTPGRINAPAAFPGIMRDADLIVLVYDVTNWRSLNDIDDWLRVAQRNTVKGVRIFLVGAKCDLNNRVLFRPHIEGFAVRNMLPVYETSALLNVGIEELFHDIVYELIRTNPVRVRDREVISLTQPEPRAPCERCCE